MCNLYSQRKPREELRGLFNISHNRAVEVSLRPQSSQTGMLPINDQIARTLGAIATAVVVLAVLWVGNALH